MIMSGPVLPLFALTVRSLDAEALDELEQLNAEVRNKARDARLMYGRMCDHCRSWFPRGQVRKCLLFEQECFLFCERGTRTTRRDVTQADNQCSISSLCMPCYQAWKANRVKCVMDDHRPGPFTMVAADLCDIEGLHYATRRPWLMWVCSHHIDDEPSSKVIGEAYHALDHYPLHLRRKNRGTQRRVKPC